MITWNTINDDVENVIITNYYHGNMLIARAYTNLENDLSCDNVTYIKKCIRGTYARIHKELLAQLELDGTNKNILYVDTI